MVTSTQHDPIATLYEQSAAKLIAQLIARLHHFERAEDALAESFAKAAALWPVDGWPAQPEAWLLRTALNHDLDQIKHQRVTERFANALVEHERAHRNDDAISGKSDRLALFFLCAHPSLSPDTQAMLMLRYCALVPPAGIARAFQLDTDTLTRRLSRAKHKLEHAGVSFQLPDQACWPDRLPVVLAALEVLYDQSYADLAGGKEIEALARDAFQLTHQLLNLIPDAAELWGFAAMLCFAESRRPARLDDDGTMIPLSEQDPKRWNQALIRRGARYLLRAAKMKQPGPYQWRASISAAYARRLELGYTPWRDVLHGYEALAALSDTPMLQINLALAEAATGQLQQAWDRLEQLDKSLVDHNQAYCLARAELLHLRGAFEDAKALLQRAKMQSRGAAERRFIEKKYRAWHAQEINMQRDPSD
ncbi:hypothetical protein C7S18_18940 [Ahniella affigens]|uniref:DUF6596 domain-containing protein n=1 Tax=Ahniella affigens TaxID=2021234 RepID=A0A2P1PW87_9GAMM|nr:DUF6596 domain-containing protein [Ahniella affigens]AVP99118.1 hypothetical protein C7S18_18940 [Ahniella affigens]